MRYPLQRNPCNIDPTARIETTANVGVPFRPLLDGRWVETGRETIVGAGVWIGQFANIGQGVIIGINSLIEDYVGIGALTTIGERVVVASRTWIGLDVTVGDDSVIKGHIDDSARIGVGCRVMGDLIHRHLDPSGGWDDPSSEEPAPIVADGAFIGWRSVIVGGVNVGARAYVCAGALVTKDVPGGFIASGRNEITHPSTWRGPLGRSGFFRSAGNEHGTAIG